jgi:hypothetical protein
MQFLQPGSKYLVLIDDFDVSYKSNHKLELELELITSPRLFRASIIFKNLQIEREPSPVLHM